MQFCFTINLLGHRALGMLCSSALPVLNQLHCLKHTAKGEEPHHLFCTAHAVALLGLGTYCAHVLSCQSMNLCKQRLKHRFSFSQGKDVQQSNTSLDSFSFHLSLSVLSFHGLLYCQRSPFCCRARWQNQNIQGQK